MLRFIRWALTVLVLPPMLVILEALLQPHVQNVVADKQLHLSVTHWWLTISESTSYLVGARWFWFAFGLLSGAVAALWMVEWFFKKSSDRK